MVQNGKDVGNMPRMARLKYQHPDDGYYHIISRTVLKSFLLDAREKEYFLSLLKNLSQVYFVKVQGFAIMSNHFHLICQMIPGDAINDEELKKRFEKYYNEGKPFTKRRVFFKHDYEDYRKRWCDVSKFVQDLKQRFSRWYNKKHNGHGHGHVWSERFKNVLLNGDKALLACMIYVELNSLRAGIVSRPEEYRYCALSHFLTGGRTSGWLDFHTLRGLLCRYYGEKLSAKKDILGRYLKI